MHLFIFLWIFRVFLRSTKEFRQSRLKQRTLERPGRGWGVSFTHTYKIPPPAEEERRDKVKLTLTWFWVWASSRCLVRRFTSATLLLSSACTWEIVSSAERSAASRAAAACTHPDLSSYTIKTERSTTCMARHRTRTQLLLHHEGCLTRTIGLPHHPTTGLQINIDNYCLK